MVSVCHRTWLSLDGKGCGWPWWSPRANGLACLWLARETSIVLKTMKSGRPWFVSPCQRTPWSLVGKGDFNGLENNEKRKTMICLRVPTNSLVFGRQRGADDHNLSPRANRLTCLLLAKETSIASEKQIWQKTLSPMKDKDRGLWVLWKTKARTLSLVKDEGEDFESYAGEPIGTSTKGL